MRRGIAARSGCDLPRRTRATSGFGIYINGMQGPLNGFFIFAAARDLKTGAFSGGIEPPLKGFGAGCSGEVAELKRITGFVQSARSPVAST